MYVKQPKSPLQIAIKTSLLKLGFETRSWVQEAPSGTGELSMVTAEEVNTDFGMYRAQTVES